MLIKRGDASQRHPFRSRRHTSGTARSDRALAENGPGKVMIQKNEERQDAEVLGVCHRPGCAVPDTRCPKTLFGRRALATRL